MTKQPDDKTEAAKGAARAAIGKLIGDDAAIRHGQAEQAKAAAKSRATQKK